MAKLIAWLGFEGGQFNAGIDGSTQKVKSMELSLRTMRKMTSMAFSLGMLAGVIDQYKQLKDYQEKTGLKLMEPGDEQALDNVASSLKRIKMELVAFVAVPIAKFLTGWRVAWAGLAALMSGGDVEQAMAGVLDEVDPEDLKASMDKYQKAKEAHADKLMNDEQKLADRMKKRAEVEKQLGSIEIAKKSGSMIGWTEKDELDLKVKQMELSDEILDLEKKVADEKKRAAKEEADYQAKVQKTIEEREDIENKLAEKQMTDAEKLLEWKDDLADMEDKIKYTINVSGEDSLEVAEYRLMMAKKELEIRALQAKIEKEAAEEREKYSKAVKSRQEKEEQLSLLYMTPDEREAAQKQRLIDMEEELAKIVEEHGLFSIEAEQMQEKIIERKIALRKRELQIQEVRRKGEQAIIDKLGGKDKDVTLNKVGGNSLQSIGGYFASKGAVAASAEDRAFKLQEEIRKIQEKTAADIADIRNNTAAD